MQVTCNRDKYYSVSIQGDFTGPYIDLELSPAVAYELLRALEAKREEIRDMAKNYYDCRDCGQTHYQSVKACPHKEEEAWN
jgi:hypothetical protein